MTPEPAPDHPHHLEVDDAVVVRAPVGLVYRTVTDVAAWTWWWPGISVLATGEHEAWRLTVGRSLAPLRLTAQATDWRHDVGFRLRLTGDLVGEVEWWLGPERGATVLHHLVRVARPDGRDPRRRAERLRRGLRRGAWGLQGWCEAAVRLALATAPAARVTPDGEGSPP